MTPIPSHLVFPLTVEQLRQHWHWSKRQLEDAAAHEICPGCEEGERVMKMTGGMLIAVHEAREACKGEPDIIERIRKAMKPCRRHWMETNEENQFKAAVAAALLESTGEEKDRLERSIAALRRVSALLAALEAGVPVDIEGMASEPPEPDIIPLNKLWNEAA